MGSVAPARRGADYARALILEISRRNADSIAGTGEADLAGVVALLDDALADPNVRQAVIFALADLLSAALQGVSLDLAAWSPPRPPL
jgi:hypothetical protein